MTFPSSDVNTTNADAGTDSPATFRSDVLDLITKFNQLRNHVSTFVQGLLTSVDAAAARTTLNAATKADRTNWQTAGTSNQVVGQIGWAYNGNNHTVFESSQGVAPNGLSVGYPDPDFAWAGAYPVLMGFNGVNTFGVRVDRAHVAENVLGYGQTRQNLTGSMGFGITYTNSTGRARLVVVGVGIPVSGGASIVVAGVVVDYLQNQTSVGAITAVLQAVVLPGETYSVSNPGGSLSSWNELR